MTEREKQELLDRIERDASHYESELHGCARCALLSLAHHLKLADDACIDTLLRASMPLSGGIAGTKNQCGALLGGIMAIGLEVVKSSPREPAIEERKASSATAKLLYRRFEKEVGHIRCYDIRDAGLGRSFDSADPDEQKRFEEAGGYVFCSGIVGKAARMAAEIILDSRK